VPGIGTTGEQGAVRTRLPNRAVLTTTSLTAIGITTGGLVAKGLAKGLATGRTAGPVAGVRLGAAKHSGTDLHVPWHLLGLRPPRQYSSKLVGFVKKRL